MLDSNNVITHCFPQKHLSARLFFGTRYNMYGLQLDAVNLFSSRVNVSISHGTNAGTNTNTNLSVQKPCYSGSATRLFIYVNFKQTDFNNLQLHKYTVKAAVPVSHINT